MASQTLTGNFPFYVSHFDTVLLCAQSEVDSQRIMVQASETQLGSPLSARWSRHAQQRPQWQGLSWKYSLVLWHHRLPHSRGQSHAKQCSTSELYLSPFSYFFFLFLFGSFLLWSSCWPGLMVLLPQLSRLGIQTRVIILYCFSSFMDV